MHVCLCRGITTSDLLDELSKRPSAFCCSEKGVSAEFAEEIHNICAEGLGYNCGACRESVKDVIDSHFATRPSSEKQTRKNKKTVTVTC